MPEALNPVDGRTVYVEDDGGPGVPVVLYGGILDTTESVRSSHLAKALSAYPGEFRLVLVDHRGLGRSANPHEPDAYAMPLQVADATAVLDALGIERAHFVGRSYGARLAFGIGEHASERVHSLVAGGQQPYAMNLDGPLARAVVAALEPTRREGAVRFVEALEANWGMRMPDFERRIYVGQDGAAVAAAAEAMLTSGDISRRLGEWRVPCLIYLGAGDLDFLDQARRAAAEIPNAEFVELDALDHLGAHFEAERIEPAVLSILRRSTAGG